MIKKIFLLFFGILCCCSLLFFSTVLTPQKFVKLASLRTSQDVLSYSELSLANTLNPQSVVQNIPYKRGRFVDVLPERRYERSIVQGKGDCSNLANGLAYSLLEQQIDFSVVHLLQMPGFTEGKGHVALEVALAIDGVHQSALLDLLEGGVLSDGHQIISSEDLISGKHDAIQVIPYHATRDQRSAYYEPGNLDTTIFGFTPDDEIKSYFTFITKVYIDLGHRAIERYAFDSIALLLGVFPKIYISSGDLALVDMEYSGARVLSKTYLWMLRVLSCLAVLLIIQATFARIQKARSR